MNRTLRAQVSTRLVLATLAGTAGQLVAPAGAVAAELREDAKTLSKRAATAFKLAHFQEALDLYTQAYEAFPAPAFLFNLGQCHKNLGHSERALFFFQGYLRDKPDASNRRAVEVLIAESNTALEAQRAAEAVALAEQQRLEELRAEKQAAEARAAAEQARRAVAGPSPLPPPVAPPELHRRPVWMIVGAAGAGAGLVLLGTGIYFGLHANADASQISQLSATGGIWNAHAQSVYDDGQSSARAATGLLVAGSILVVSGAALGLLGLAKHADPPVTAALVPQTGGSAVVVAGRF